MKAMNFTNSVNSGCTNELWTYQNAMFEITGEKIYKVAMKKYQNSNRFFVAEYTDLKTDVQNKSVGLEIEWTYLQSKNSEFNT